MKNNGDMYIAKDIIVKINLGTRSMIQATMGGRELTPLATYTILVFHVENGGTRCSLFVIRYCVASTSRIHIFLVQPILFLLRVPFI